MTCYGKETMGDDLISVIIPVYNAEKYLKHCVDSVLQQSYRNFELILVNDGSVDNSLELCKKLALNDERIVVVDQENGGAGAARNTGLDTMQGRYVVFIDSDDYVNENYLLNLYLAAKFGAFDIAQCDLRETFDRDVSTAPVSYCIEDVEQITKKRALNDRLYKVSIWGKIYSSRIFEGFRFQEGIIYEDDASYYIFVDKAERIAILHETLYYYFQSKNSVMRNDKKDKSTAFVEIYEERIRYFSSKGDKALLEGTYDRFCLVLMLTTASSLFHGTNLGDIDRFLKLFKRYYPMAMRSTYVSWKDKMMFSVFRAAPRPVGRAIGRMRG